ncbi:MAG: response regulator, partial [Chloroflexota bacterium]
LNLLIAALDIGARALTFTGSESSRFVELQLLVEGIEGGGVGARETLVRQLQEDRSLKVSRRLLELQGGEATVEDGRTGGAVVRVSLPFVRLRRVLLVDDNPDTLRLFGRYLEGQGYRVLVAQDGSEGIRLALQEQPDAVVLDVMMPAQDGWEVLQVLSNRVETADIPVIICSVIAQRDLALSLGAVDLLAKPVNLPSLAEALSRCLGGSRASAG